IHNGGARVDPKDLIKKQNPFQRSKQNNDRLRGYNAWEHRHVKAPWHNIAAESETPERKHSADVQRHKKNGNNEGPIKRITPHIEREKMGNQPVGGVGF